MKTRAVVLSLILFGCAGPDATGTTTELGDSAEDEIGATRASRELRAAQGTSTVVEAPGPGGEVVPEPAAPAPLAAPVPPAAPVERTPFTVRVVDATRGENGRGEVVAAVSPIAFDLDAREFPVRALDPVLYIGELRFLEYTYPSPGVLRFIAADRGEVPEGVEVAIQYGEDTASRRVVAPALELP